MNETDYETKYDSKLFAELYDVQPQAITWMKPVWSDDGYTITDFEYVYSNKEGLSFLNFTPEQFRGLRISTTPMLTDDLRKLVLEEMATVYLTGQDLIMNLYNPALNKYVRELRTRLRDGVLTVIQDCTEENRIINQLEVQTKELNTKKNLVDNILQNSSNGISVSKIFRDDGGKVVDALTILANDAAVKYIGLPKDVYLSKRATELEPGIISSPYYQMCIKTLETGEPFAMQYQMESTGRWLELTVSKMDDDHLIQVFSDVTSVKEVQLQLEKAAATLRTVFDFAQTGMFTFTPVYNYEGVIADFRYVMVNKIISAYAFQPPEALEGELGIKWFPGYLTNGEFDLYKQCFETGEPQRKELHYQFEGRDYYLDLQSIKIEGQLLVTLTDYTSLRLSQLELQQTVKALERSNNHLEDFAHAASHDMKEPLRKIRTFTDRLKHRLVSNMDETDTKLFERIEASAERMQLLVDDLLEFSHVSEQPQQLEGVDMAEKIRKVLSDLELLIEEKAAQINVGILPTVQGNRRQLQQLFQNLIGNALKYNQPGKTPVINITSRTIHGADEPTHVLPEQSDKLFYLIEVTDNGIGFEQQYAEKIFKMFQRLHGKSEYAGTGVGLSIARKVVENHGGYIWATGKPGEGAVFHVLLPA